MTAFVRLTKRTNSAVSRNRTTRRKYRSRDFYRGQRLQNTESCAAQRKREKGMEKMKPALIALFRSTTRPCLSRASATRSPGRPTGIRGDRRPELRYGRIESAWTPTDLCQHLTPPRSAQSAFMRDIRSIDGNDVPVENQGGHGVALHTQGKGRGGVRTPLFGNC